MTAPITTVGRLECQGCAACAAVCPRNCIAMRYDHEGFLYPEVDENECIACGKCAGACPVLAPIMPNPKGEYHAVQLSDAVALERSASGGVFYGLAQQTIEDGGVAVGCILNDEIVPVHSIAENTEELVAMQGSKYVQSYVPRETYEQIRAFLYTGREVLFCGTPCQVAALRNYLGGCTDGLTTIDLICHGVAGPGLWQSYIGEVERKSNGKVVGAEFRSKKVAPHPNNRSMIFIVQRADEKDGRSERLGNRALDDPYGASFYHNRILRECCYRCPYARQERMADITIGDYGENDITPPTNGGLSFVAINTMRGFELLERANCRFWIADIPSGYSQVNLQQPTLRPSSRDKLSEMQFDAENPRASTDYRLHITTSDRLKALLPTGLKNNAKVLIHNFKARKR
jgi:coenzyme F420-reducing hydrogenase beta subunit